MEAKQKAKALVEECMGTIIFNISQEIESSVIPAAKRLAILCVDQSIFFLKEPLIGDLICKENINNEISYLKSVKQEIESL